jgi:hypothetical protein
MNRRAFITLGGSIPARNPETGSGSQTSRLSAESAKKHRQMGLRERSI